MRRRIAWTLGLALALAAGAARAEEPPLPEGLMDPAAARAALAGTDAPAPTTAPAAAASEAMLGSVRGQLRPVRQTILAAGLAGQVEAVTVEPGQAVTAGTVLVRMDCAALQADKATAAAKRDAAAARYAVNRRLAELNNISGLDVDLSRAELAVAKAEGQRIEAQMRFCQITAPFDGVVVGKRVQAFQHVQAGEPLLDLMDPSDLVVDVAVPSTWLAEVRPGQAFEMRVDELRHTARGVIDRNEGRVDPVSQMVRLIGHLDAPPAGLLPGMSGEIVLLSGPGSAP